MEKNARLPRLDAERRRVVERALAGLLEYAPDAIVVADRAGIILSVNRHAEELFGHPREKMIGFAVERLIPERMRATHVAARTAYVRAPRAGSMKAGGDLWALRKDGSELPIDVMLAHAEIDDELVVIVSVRDATERFRASADAALLSAVVTSSEAAIFTASLDGIITSWNPGAQRTYGYAPQEVIGKSLFDCLVPPERSEETRQLYRRLREGATLEPFETIRTRRDGSLVPVSLTLSSVRDRQGRIVGVSHISRDVSAEVASRQALRDRDRKLRGLFENAFQFIGLLSKDGSVLEANRTALNFIGASREQVVGKPFWETPWWSHSAELAIRLRQAIAEASEGAFVRFEAQHRGRDGRMMAVDFSLTPVRDDTGAVIYLIPEGRDVTALKELEKLRGDYVHFLAHDLRNPVGTMGLHAEILQRGLPTRGMHGLKQSVEVILENVRRVDVMITGLLEEVRMEPGRTHLHLQPVLLRELVLRVISNSVGPADATRIHVLEKERVPPLLCDVPRVERVVQNLLTNAVKYAPAPGAIEVIIECDSRDARISVRDHGPGLALEDQRRIFEKYERVRPTAESLGLGLYICRLIVEAHGGRIWVDSAPQQGATFTFSLPLVTQPEIPKHESQVSITAIPEVSAANARVLVVEDDGAACEALAQLLGEEGYQVITAKSGVHALAELEQFKPDVALVDLSMPVMNGAEFIHQARARIADLPCILMTGQERSSAQVEALRIEGYVKKPVNFSVLLESLERVLRMKAAPS